MCHLGFFFVYQLHVMIWTTLACSFSLLYYAYCYYLVDIQNVGNFNLSFGYLSCEMQRLNLDYHLKYIIKANFIFLCVIINFSFSGLKVPLSKLYLFELIIYICGIDSVELYLWGIIESVHTSFFCLPRYKSAG